MKSRKLGITQLIRLCCIIPALLIAACGGSNDGGVGDTATAKSAQNGSAQAVAHNLQGYPAMSERWPGGIDSVVESTTSPYYHDPESSLWFVRQYGSKDHPEIHVCWEMGADEFAQSATKREIVRNVIATTWDPIVTDHDDGFYTTINPIFRRWTRCDEVSPLPRNLVRIRVADEIPHTTGLGKSLNNKVGGVTLNFTFDSMKNGAAYCSANEKQNKDCIEWYAVHEFGHVLGFAHEQNRPDTPDACKGMAQGTDGDQLFGSWDGSSVMSYCNVANGNPVNTNMGMAVLSAEDKAMVKTLYGESMMICDIC